jgi:hypothetical protein|tara:strand:+ start:231 stop:608 length:378 start_codon:yes stop_codon:yes gene_type:complete
MSIETNPDFWDCECEYDYIHNKKESDLNCAKCNTSHEEQPDSREIEVQWMKKMKKIEITEYMCNPHVFLLEEFIKAQTIDVHGNVLPVEECQLLDEEISSLRDLIVGESMDLGEPEAGLIVTRVA